jgi:Holliday junction resolvase RusA-like endonuclease
VTDRFILFVPGRPIPQGSKHAFVSKSTGRPMVKDNDLRLPQWRMKITAHAIERQAEYMHTHPDLYGLLPFTSAVGVSVTFILDRPRGHFGTGRNAAVLKPSAPPFPATMPDLDKLLRAVFDGLTDGQVWRDDGQVVYCLTAKYFVGFLPRYVQEGVHIEIGEMR